MATTILVDTAPHTDLSHFFELLVDGEDVLERDNISFQAKTSGASPTAAGLPEITDLIIGLGTAGAFTALAGILRDYFKYRPKGSITFTVKENGKNVTFTANNVNAEEISDALKSLKV